MPQLDEIGGWIAKRLPELLTEHKVPGAAIGVHAGGQVIDYAFGVLSHATGVEATTDSVFQVGSITKTWTATLVMQLADEGLLDIGKPLRAYLPEFVLADEPGRGDAGKQVDVPPLGLMGTHWGLGWELFHWPGGMVFGHDGGTIGQSAFLRIVPGHDVAIALLTNGGNPIAVYREVFDHLLSELAGIHLNEFPAPPEHPARIDAARYVGTYANSVGQSTVTQDEEGRIWMEDKPLGELAELVGQSEKAELVHLTGDTLIPVEPKYGMRIPQVFTGDDGSGRALFIHSGRAIRRAG